MKNLRKCAKPVFALMLIMCVLFAMAVPSFAVNTQTLDENTTAGDATVWYQTDRNLDPDPTGDLTPDEDVNDNYTVTIPEKVLATKVGDAELNQYEVKAEDVLIHPAKKLDITCTYSGEMTHHDASITKLAYKMQNKSTDFTSGDVILSVAAGDPFTPSTTEVCAILTAAPLFAGVYEGVATFACAVVDAA